MFIMSLMYVTVLLLLGLCLGSFINALVWRIHEQGQQSAKTKKIRANKNISILTGRSMCVDCHHTLAWYDLVPVFSWLSLGGKCRYCKKPISTQYPLVEATVAGLFVLSYISWPNELGAWNLELGTFILWLVLLTGLIALLVYDLKWMILPNRILFPLFIPATLFALINAALADNFLLSNFYALVATLVGGGIFWVLFQISGGKWIGGGDVKLGFLLGLILGTPVRALGMIVLASLIGTFIALPLLVSKKLKVSSHIPFGPMLIASAIIIQLYGQNIFDWYTNLII